MSTLALEELIAGPRPHNIRNVNSGFIDPQVTHLGGTTGAFATPKTPESLSLRQGDLRLEGLSGRAWRLGEDLRIWGGSRGGTQGPEIYRRDLGQIGGETFRRKTHVSK